MIAFGLLISVLTVASLIATVSAVTLLVSERNARAADCQARIDFKAEYTKALATVLDGHNLMASQIKTIVDRMQGLEMRHMVVKK